MITSPEEVSCVDSVRFALKAIQKATTDHRVFGKEKSKEIIYSFFHAVRSVYSMKHLVPFSATKHETSCVVLFASRTIIIPSLT